MQLPKAASLHPEAPAPTRAPVCDIRAREEGGAHVIHLEGELDLADCPRLDRALTDAEFSLAGSVVVDCDELEFIDAAGLNSLYAASVRSLQTGVRLRITRGTKGVAKLFKVSGLDAVLPLVGSRNAA